MNIPLKTQAVADYRGKTYHNPVVLRPSHYEGQGLALVIVDTPGQWCLSTLLGMDPYGGPAANHTSIDGNDWTCTNMHELLEEALAIVFGEHAPALGTFGGAQ